jgi:MFS transporter, DHA1 family, multidrug resistance protein
MIMKEFDISMTFAIFGMSIFLLGVAFSPIHSPHVAERVGRSVFYLTTFFIFMLFMLGSTRSTTFAGVLVCRFFAGLFGGPCLVLIEGTFADVWSADTTNSYYAFLASASYIGAALGPLVGGFVVTAKGWRWSGYVSLMISFGVWLFSFGISETYQREIPRRRAKAQGQILKQSPAESGVTFAQMFKITVITPAVMLVSEPIVMLTTLHIILNWAVLFSWFIVVPAVLTSVYNFTLQQAGLAFISAIAGTILAAVTAVVIEQFIYRKTLQNTKLTMASIEFRLIPAMIGAVLLPASLFWVGWTAKPTIHWAAPVIGTAVYVYASLLMIISYISYLFDAYPPAGTLSALTTAAVMRIVLAAMIPLCILHMFARLTGAWALSVFGFIGFAFMPIPFVLFYFGKKLRENSRYSARPMMATEVMNDKTEEPTEEKMEEPMGQMMEEPLTTSRT